MLRWGLRIFRPLMRLYNKRACTDYDTFLKYYNYLLIICLYIESDINYWPAAIIT